MQTILVTGSNGQLGGELLKLSKRHPDFKFVFIDVEELDITNFDLVRKFFELNRIDFCINAAAYTAVDKAESEVDQAFLVNQDAVENLAAVCHDRDITLFHVSTDFIFDGKLTRPYKENDAPHPLNAYGQSKLGGELKAQAVCKKLLIVRTGWLYAKEGKNFLNTMLRLGKERSEVSVVNDQIGTPTNARDLAACLMKMVTDPDLSRKYSTYHFANEGVCSWYDFAVAIMEMARLDCKVKPVPTEDYQTPAVRPRYSVLDKAKVKEAFGLEIAKWRESLGALHISRAHLKA